METYLFRHKEFSLEYIRFGNGSETLLCFHGFDRSMNDFLLFEEELQNRYTIYSFNFFHHGNTVYPQQRIDKNTLRMEELKELFYDFFQQKNIQRFSLMGYSMGGKISFALLHCFPLQIDTMYLMAPDGIKVNFWYSFTSKNRVGNVLYRFLLKKPEPFFRFMRALKLYRLLSDKLYRFVLFNLETEAKRKQVYNVWLTLRLIEPKASQSARLINENNIHCYLFFGKYDSVIPPRIGEYFVQLLNEKHLHVVETGHNLFRGEMKNELKKILQ
ncbi:MAG: alpha/beta fold hydrolase [Bacteroidota bacterium]